VAAPNCSTRRRIARDVDAGDLDPTDVDVETVEERLYDRPVRDVDLIVRTGGDERTSNFLPWHANGNEAAVYFCAPYWPEFSEVEFLRAIRTYQSREESWRQARAERAVALVRAVAEVEIAEAHAVAGRLRDRLPLDADALAAALPGDDGTRSRIGLKTDPRRNRNRERGPNSDRRTRRRAGVGGLRSRKERREKRTVPRYAGFFRVRSLPQIGHRSLFSSKVRLQPTHWNRHSRSSVIPSRAIASTEMSSRSATFCIA